MKFLFFGYFKTSGWDWAEVFKQEGQELQALFLSQTINLAISFTKIELFRPSEEEKRYA
jgi:hypothetical protein